jgi:hypothetical protein
LPVPTFCVSGIITSEVAVILDLVPQLLQPLLEVGDADRGRAHVDAAAAGAEVDRHPMTPMLRSLSWP